MPDQPSASQPTIVFFGGKGGVGKTTMSSAYALASAGSGLRTLLLSTDPAHSIGDAFGVDLGDEPRELAPLLTARQPDPEAAIRRRIAQVTDDAAAVVPPEVMPAVTRHLKFAGSGPGMTESALTDQLIEAMSLVGREWDRLVVDAPPTGHLLRLLALPDLLTPWVSGLARQRHSAIRAERFATAVAGERDGGVVDDPLLARLHARRLRLEAASEQLRAPTTLIRLVFVPRKMVLAETERAAAELRRSSLHLGPAVLNQVGPDADPEVVTTARRLFADAAGVVEIPLQAREPVGIAELTKLSMLL